jgi:hypothetical protein
VTVAARWASGSGGSRRSWRAAVARRAVVDRVTGEIAERARQTVSEARRVARNARRWLGPDGRRAVLVDRLEREFEAAEEVLAQTELRLQGQRTIPDRRVSLVDPDMTSAPGRIQAGEERPGLNFHDSWYSHP